jgi:hypothetical protein
MKKIVLVTLTALLIGGCGILPTPPVIPTQPVIVESPTTVPTETFTALPTDTAVPATETFTSTADVLLNPTITPFSPENLTTTAATLSNTPTPISFPSTTTPSPTLGVLTYGTLPPAVPSKVITLWNKSKAEAYISLQQQEGGAILEYPVKGQVRVDVPLGQYIYVAWVGGKKMTGSFRLSALDTIRITLYKDRVVIEKL